MTVLACTKCGGEGALYNCEPLDRNAWRIGPCPQCEGSCSQTCDILDCEELAVEFDDDGNALCECHLGEWMRDVWQ